MISNPSAVYITSQQQLDEVVVLIDLVKVVAIDTEFTRETTYYPILSIIQIAVEIAENEQRYFIIDALLGLDLTGFYEIIADPEIIKILHSSIQDLQIFHCKSNLLPGGIVDTQIMANFCGVGFNIGYSGLVEKFFGQTLNKKQQRSDWQKRPLSKKQIEYAVLDVKFLHDIYKELFQILREQNRVEWYFEEMNWFLSKILAKTEESLFRDFSFRGKSPRQVSQMKNLILWREECAKKADVPRRHFMRDEVLEKIVSGEVFNLNFSQVLLDEIEKIMNMEDTEFFIPERSPSMTETQKKCYENAKKLIQEVSEKCGIEGRFLMPNHELKRSSFDQNFFNEKVSGWRYQLFGKELEKLTNFSL